MSAKRNEHGPQDDKLPIRMLHDRVLVRQDTGEGERRSGGGILIPATAAVGKRLAWAEVVAVGQNVRTVEPGDRVLYDPEDRAEVEVRGVGYVLMRERDLHAVAADRFEGRRTPPGCISESRVQVGLQGLVIKVTSPFPLPLLPWEAPRRDAPYRAEGKDDAPPFSSFTEVPVMAWVLLFVAGLLEVGWSIGMKYTDGFTRLWPSVFTGAGIVASMMLLSYAARTLPIGTAYGVWVGIGAAGAAVLGMVVLGEPATAARIFFICLLLVAVVGLKATSGH